MGQGNLGSTREINRLERRQAMLAAATESFLTHGYAGTTMSAISAEIGGSKGTLWSYFPSKSALFEEALEHEISVHHATMLQALLPCKDLASTLHRFAYRFISTAYSPRSLALLRLVYGESARFPEIGEIWFRQVICRTEEFLSEVFRAAMEEGHLCEEDSFAAARVFVSLCMSGIDQQLMLHHRTARTTKDVKIEAALVTDFFMKAFTPH